MRAILVSSLALTATAMISGCTTTTTTGGAGSVVGTSIGFGGYVEPEMAQACVNSAANKYYLPTNVIRAVNAQKIGTGATQVTLQVDRRSALCTINSAGSVMSVVDTSPKSADQIAAETASVSKPAVSKPTVSKPTRARAASET